MPKSLRMRSRRNRKGGMWPFDSSSSSNNGYSATTQGSSWYDNLNPFGKKDQNTDYPTSYPTSSPNSYPPTSYGSPTSYPNSYGSPTSFGGKQRRGMRGGSVSPNMSLTNLASSAAPISGGRTRRRFHRHTKSCKKSCKKR